MVVVVAVALVAGALREEAGQKHGHGQLLKRVVPRSVLRRRRR